jgi:hypothetical protein
VMPTDQIAPVDESLAADDPAMVTGDEPADDVANPRGDRSAPGKDSRSGRRKGSATQRGDTMLTDEIAPVDKSPAGDDPTSATIDTPTQDAANSDSNAGAGESSPRPVTGDEPGTRGDTDQPRDGEEPAAKGKRGKSSKGTKRRSDTPGTAPKTAGNKPYQIVKTRQSANATDAAVVVDDDPTTAWRTTSGETPHEAYVDLDLGKRRTVGSVRWLVAPDGLAGTLHVEVSPDGKRWKMVAGVAQDATDDWQELRLKHTVEARYVRLVFTNPTKESRLGGLAEVEIRPAAKSDANGGGPKQDRQRGQSGQAKAKPGQERVKSGKQRHGSQTPPGSRDQAQEPRQEPPTTDADQPPGDDDPQGRGQEPTQAEEKAGQQREPDQEQGKERNTGPERNKDTAKSTHKRAQRGGGK